MFFSKIITLGAFLQACVSAAPVKEASPDALDILEKRATPASSEEFAELQRAARLSSAAYTSFICQQSAHGVNITKQINNLITSTQGYVGYDSQKKRITVAMRGSTFFTDFFNDLDITPGTPQLSGVNFPEGTQVMNGIIRPWSSVHDEVIEEVRRLTTQFPDYSLESTGHSLGGALTYMSYVALAQNFPDKEITSNSLAAFAIGNDVFANFAESQNGLLRRGNNAIDGVPNMYPFFKHYGTEFFGYGQAENTVKCEGQLDTACSAGQPVIGLTPGHFQSFGIALGLAGCG